MALIPPDLIRQSTQSNGRTRLTKLLHCLYPASYQESFLALDRIVPEKVLPRPATDGLFHGSVVHDVCVKLGDLLIAELVALQSLEDVSSLLMSVMCNQPSRSLVYDEAEEQHCSEEYNLQDAWDSPGIAFGVETEAIPHPVDQEDAEVECTELHTDI